MLDARVLELKKQLFLEAYRRHHGNLSAIKHVLGISMRQTLKLYKLFTKEELKRLLLPPRDPVVEWAANRVVLSRGIN